MNNPKILVVDDNEVVLKALSLKLTSNNFTVITAKDGSQAIAAVRKSPPDVIVLDISFPAEPGAHWDGFSIMDWLHRLDYAKNLPVIVITGGDPAKYKQRAMEKGAVKFFQKPVESQELIDTIKEALRTQASAPAAPPPSK